MREPGEDSISVQAAADLLGVQFRTFYALIDRGELPAEVTVPRGPKRRRSVRLRRRDLDQYIESARLKPGELRHLHPEWPWGPLQRRKQEGDWVRGPLIDVVKTSLAVLAMAALGGLLMWAFRSLGS